MVTVDEAGRRRARRRIYESMGVALFMTLVLLALWWYVTTRAP